MTWRDWFVPVAAVVAVFVWRAIVVRLFQRRKTTVVTRDPALNRDQQPHASPPLVASLRGPASKGFRGQLRGQREIEDRELDRRAHVHAMKGRRL